MRNAQLRVSVDEELDMAIMEKMAEESATGLDITRGQCLAYFARLGIKAWKSKSSQDPPETTRPLSSLGRGDQALVNRLFKRKTHA